MSLPRTPSPNKTGSTELRSKFSDTPPHKTRTIGAFVQKLTLSSKNRSKAPSLGPPPAEAKIPTSKSMSKLTWRKIRGPKKRDAIPSFPEPVPPLPVRKPNKSAPSSPRKSRVQSHASLSESLFQAGSLNSLQSLQAALESCQFPDPPVRQNDSWVFDQALPTSRTYFDRYPPFDSPVHSSQSLPPHTIHRTEVSMAERLHDSKTSPKRSPRKASRKSPRALSSLSARFPSSSPQKPSGEGNTSLDSDPFVLGPLRERSAHEFNNAQVLTDSEKQQDPQSAAPKTGPNSITEEVSPLATLSKLQQKALSAADNLAIKAKTLTRSPRALGRSYSKVADGEDNDASDKSESGFTSYQTSPSKYSSQQDLAADLSDNEKSRSGDICKSDPAEASKRNSFSMSLSTVISSRAILQPQNPHAVEAQSCEPAVGVPAATGSLSDAQSVTEPQSIPDSADKKHRFGPLNPFSCLLNSDLVFDQDVHHNNEVAHEAAVATDCTSYQDQTPACRDERTASASLHPCSSATRFIEMFNWVGSSRPRTILEERESVILASLPSSSSRHESDLEQPAISPQRSSKSAQQIWTQTSTSNEKGPKLPHLSKSTGATFFLSGTSRIPPVETTLPEPFLLPSASSSDAASTLGREYFQISSPATDQELGSSGPFTAPPRSSSKSHARIKQWQLRTHCDESRDWALEPPSPNFSVNQLHMPPESDLQADRDESQESEQHSGTPLILRDQGETTSKRLRRPRAPPPVMVDSIQGTRITAVPRSSDTLNLRLRTKESTVQQPMHHDTRKAWSAPAHKTRFALRVEDSSSTMEFLDPTAGSTPTMLDHRHAEICHGARSPISPTSTGAFSDTSSTLVGTPPMIKGEQRREWKDTKKSKHRNAVIHTAELDPVSPSFHYFPNVIPLEGKESVRSIQETRWDALISAVEDEDPQGRSMGFNAEAWGTMARQPQ